MKFHTKAFALTCGIFWGLGIFLLTWWLIAVGNAEGPMTILERGYIGFTFTPMGSLIGLAWGFVDGFIGGAIFAWLYNKISGCWHGACQKEGKQKAQ